MPDLILVARPKSTRVEPAPVGGGGLIALVSKAKALTGKVVTVTEPSSDGLCSVVDVETDYDDRTRGYPARKAHGEPRFYFNGKQITRDEYKTLAKDMGDDADSPGDTTLSMPPCPKCMKSDGVYPVDYADAQLDEPPITDSADSIKPGQAYVCSICKCTFKDKTLPPVDGPGVPRQIQRSTEPEVEKTVEPAPIEAPKSAEPTDATVGAAPAK